MAQGVTKDSAEVPVGTQILDNITALVTGVVKSGTVKENMRSGLSGTANVTERGYNTRKARLVFIGIE